MTNTAGVLGMSQPERYDARIPAIDRIKEQLQRVVDSRTFQRASRLKRLLEYVVKGALNGDPGGQMRAAREVFGKEEGFDPSIDPVIRVQFGRLRRTLSNYYATEGKNDSLVIRVPNRQYTPIFEELNPFDSQGGTSNSSKVSPAPQSAGTHDGAGIDAPVNARPVIAVMPFANLTDDPSHDSFCYGLTEEIISELAGVDSVDTVVSSSTFQFKDEHVDVRDVGRELGVHLVLEGTVRMEDGDTRVTAQLARSLDGVAVWSESFDGRMNGSLNTQKSIAHKVMEKLPLDR
jgi:adenylate cyclase